MDGCPEERQRQQLSTSSALGSTRAVNVMCHKLDMKYRHQLSSLGVYREKIKASSVAEDISNKAGEVDAERG